MKINEDYLLELTTYFFIRKKMIIGITFIISLAAVLIAIFLPPTYAIVSNILVKGKQVEKNLDSLAKGVSKSFELSKEDLNSEIELLTSHDVIRKTVDLLVKTEPLFQKMHLPETEIRKLVSSIKGGLLPEIVPHSNVIKVTLTTKVPSQGLVILEKLLEQYMDYRSLIYNPSQAAPFFKEQVDEYKKRIIVLEKQLDQIVSDFSTADPLKEIESNLLIKQDLTQQLNIAKSALIEKQRSVNNLRAAINDKRIQLFAFIDNLSISSFSDKLQSLIIEKGDLLRKFHPESVNVMRVEEQIQKTYDVLKSEVTTYLSEQENQEWILKDKVDSLESRLNEIDTRNIELHGISLSYNRMRNDLDLMQDSYRTLMTRWEETKIKRASDINALSLVSISSKPYFSGSPIFPNKNTLIPVGILAGIVTGLSLGFLLEYFDQRIKRPEDVLQLLDQPTLFSLPRS